MKKTQEQKILTAQELAANEFLKLTERLLDPYGNEAHFKIVMAAQTENGWALKIERISGAGNENHK